MKVGLFTNFLLKNGVGGDGGNIFIFKDNVDDLDGVVHCHFFYL